SLAKTTFKLRDELVFCRSPFIPASEFPDDYDPTNKSPEKEGDAYAHIYAKRWKPVTEAIQEFDTCALEAEALWGSGIKEKTVSFILSGSTYQPCAMLKANLKDM
ncbi:MAG: hypothetical protein V7784_09010, partial [Oceanospirillaceae bacterium]